MSGRAWVLDVSPAAPHVQVTWWQLLALQQLPQAWLPTPHTLCLDRCAGPVPEVASCPSLVAAGCPPAQSPQLEGVSCFPLAPPRRGLSAAMQQD